MKILAFTPLYLPVTGGIEMIVADLSSGLNARGIETAVVTDKVGDLPEFETINGTRVHRLNFARPMQDSDLRSTLLNIQALSRILDEERPDILHVHSASQAAIFYLDRVLSKRLSRPPIVVTQHGCLESPDKAEVTRRMILDADLLTAVSQAALESAVAFTGRTSPSLVIRNGITIHSEFPRARTIPERHRLLCVGRMQREKGFDIAIDAMANIIERGVRAELVLVGYGEDRSKLEERSRDLGISQHVIFLHPLERSRVRQLMAESSILLAPSRTREGFSLVAAEAASVGTPCIVSDIGGLPETVEHEVTGLVVPNENVEAFAHSIRLTLSDPSFWFQLSMQSYDRSRERFDLARCIESYASAYRKVVANGGAIAKMECR